MALSTLSYYSNSIIGDPELGSDIDIYASSSNPKYPVGFGFIRSDGNRYRYSQFGAICNRGNITSKLGTETNVTKIANVGALVANITKRAGEIYNPNVIGSRYLQLVITATANQFMGGYLTITSSTGAGFTYRIRGNTATTAGNPVTGNIYMDLYDQVQVALDSNTNISIAGMHYTDLFPANVASASAATIAGVTVTNNSASSYGFVCTHGTIGVLQDATIGIYGQNAVLSSATAGAVSALPQSSHTNFALYPGVGYFIEPGSSTDYSIVYLEIE